VTSPFRNTWRSGSTALQNDELWSKKLLCLSFDPVEHTVADLRVNITDIDSVQTLIQFSYHRFRRSCRQAHCLNHLYTTQLNLGHLAPCGWEPVVISLNCLLLSMNSTNETLLFDRFSIMYNLCVFTCIILIFVFHCTHVRMSYVLNFYLLTYLLVCALLKTVPFCRAYETLL